MDLSGDGMDWLNASSSGNETMNDTFPTFQLIFPCRERPISSNTTSPFVWGILPELEAARPYVATIQALFILVGVIWNLFVLISYCIKPRLLKEPANIYLFNLVVSDLILTVFITFSSFLVEVIGEFIFGSSDLVRCNYCLFLGVVMHTLISVSLHTLMALSVDRFVVLFKPMSYKSIFNWRRALVIQAFLWVIAIGVSITPIFGFGEYEFNLGLAACHARWSGESFRGISNLYYVIFYGVEALIPILILAFTNIWVVKIVSSFLKKRIKRRRTYREDNNSQSHQEERQYQRQQQQLIRVFGALFVAHIVCWTPVLTASFVAAGIGATKIPVEIYVFGWLAYLIIPVVHPILESFFIKDLRYRMEKTRTSVRSSFRRAKGSLYSQVSNTSLAKSLGRRLSTSEAPNLQRKSTQTELSTTTDHHRALARILSTTSMTSRQTVAHTLSNGSLKSSEPSKVGRAQRNRASTTSSSSADQAKAECESFVEQNGTAKKRGKKFSTVSFKDSPEIIIEVREVGPAHNSAPTSVFMEPTTDAESAVDRELREAIAKTELQDDVLEA